MASFRSKRFELKRKLGEGSIGIVYEAYDRDQNMRVALKLLRRLVPSGLYRLKQEFRALRSISHPNIVTLHDLVSESDSWFITMELIEGEDFVSYVRNAGAPPESAGTLDESRLRHVLAQIAQALHTMHMAGLIHRDLKPCNVRVTELGRAVLMDFSIVAEAQNILDHSGSGNVMLGTPLYMAPEQAAGDAPSPALDWYALGVMTYQALTGRLPFEGHWDDVLIDKQDRDPVPPSQLVEHIPEDLDQLCRALLARHPHERPAGPDILQALGVASENTASVLHGMGEGVFVGRDREFALLDHAYERVRAGESVCVLFRGIPGMGKSKLLQRFTTQLKRSRDEPVIVLSGSCQPRDQRCYNALDEIVDGLSRTLIELPGQRLQAVLPAGVALLATMFPVLLRVSGIESAFRAGSASPDEQRDRAVDALRRLLGNLAAWRPLVICIDDLHWADADSLAVLRELSRPPAPEHMLWVLAVEDPEHHKEPTSTDRGSEQAAQAPSEAERIYQAMDLGASGTCHLVELTELPRQAQQALLNQWLGGSRTIIEQRGVTRAHGTPLYLSELARHVVESGASDVDASPDDLDEVLEQRIRRLPDSGRALLDVIALSGRATPLSVLAKAANQGMGEVERASAMLRAARLLRVARPGRDPWLTPYHHKVSEVVERMLSEQDRRDVHQRLALALQRLGQPSSDALAHHWRAAGDLEQARSHLSSAAQNAAERLAFERAAALYRAALDTAEPGSRSRQSLLRSLGRMLSLGGQHLQAAGAYDLAARSADAELALELRREAADQRLRGGQIDAGLTELGDIAAELGAPLDPDRVKKGMRLTQRMRLLLRRRRYRTRSENQIAARDLDRLDTMYAAALPLAMLDHGRGTPVQAEHLLIALRHGEPLRVARALACQVPAALLGGGRQSGRARDLVAEVRATAKRIDDPRLTGLALLGAGLVDLASEEYATAEPGLARAVEIFADHIRDARDAHWELLAARYLHCLALMAQGRLRDATALIARLAFRAERTGDLVARTLFGCRPAMWRAMRRDRVDTALDNIAALVAAWPPGSAQTVGHLMHIARTMGHVYRGDGQRARAAMDACQQHVRHVHLAGTPLFMTEMHALEGRVALLEGDHDRAGKAVARLARVESALAQGQAALLGAALSYAKTLRDQARDQLGRASSLFHGAGASHFAAGAAFRLGQLLGPDQGSAHTREAMAWCQRESIANAKRMFDYLSPWIRRTVDE